MDIVQEGNLGLIQAAGKYDYRRNVRFCTYASWWIRQFISRYLVNKGRMVRLPHRQEELLRKIQHAYHNLSQTLMRQPKFAEIAEALGVSTQDVAFVLNMSSCPLPLEYETREEESAVVMEIHEDYTYNPERTLFRKFSRDGIRHVLEKLKDREQRIIRYRYQLDGNERFTLKKTGDAMGLSPETIRQIELKALGKIRAHVEELKDSVYPEAM
jgi:RNA polymerase primary sigma factor